MKKDRKAKRMSLHVTSETIRVLRESQLTEIIGGNATENGCTGGTTRGTNCGYCQV